MLPFNLPDASFIIFFDFLGIRGCARGRARRSVEDMEATMTPTYYTNFEQLRMACAELGYSVSRERLRQLWAEGKIGSSGTDALGDPVWTPSYVKKIVEERTQKT